jgi:hypothetical protein
MNLCILGQAAGRIFSNSAICVVPRQCVSPHLAHFVIHFSFFLFANLLLTSQNRKGTTLLFPWKNGSSYFVLQWLCPPNRNKQFCLSPCCSLLFLLLRIPKLPSLPWSAHCGTNWRYRICVLSVPGPITWARHQARSCALPHYYQD